jgi:protein required for attachment to host cells
LRESLSSQCTALLTSEINKDLVNHNIKDIRSHLPTHL